MNFLFSNQAHIENLLFGEERPNHNLLLIIGPPSCGKSYLVDHIAEKHFPSKPHPDFQIIDCKESIGVSEVKEISQEISELSAFGENERYFIFDHIEELNVQSQNALLKSFEEPLPGNNCIMLSNRSDRILPTVKSRALKIIMPKVPSAEIKNRFNIDSDFDLFLAGESLSFAKKIAYEGRPKWVEWVLKKITLKQTVKKQHLKELADRNKENASEFLVVLSKLLNQLMVDPEKLALDKERSFDYFSKSENKLYLADCIDFIEEKISLLDRPINHERLILSALYKIFQLENA